MLNSSPGSRQSGPGNTLNNRMQGSRLGGQPQIDGDFMSESGDAFGNTYGAGGSGGGFPFRGRNLN